MRTLLRDESFGEVSDRPATTRHVEGATLLVGGRPLVELYDTPGLEDSIGLLDHLESMRGDGHRRADQYRQIEAFLTSPEAHGRFAQEAKALRQVLASDVALYVIDARDRVLGKHRDELEILARCGRPVVPLLNFVASSDAQTATWREHLSRINLHAVAEFDTVVLDEESERRLLEKMRTLLDHQQQTLDALIGERRQQRARLVHASAALVADMLIDAAAAVMAAPATGGADAQHAIESLKQRIRDREQNCVEQLLALHRFTASGVEGHDLPLTQGRWGVDLFSPAAMKQFGIRTGGAAAAGAMVGLTVDAMVGGMSLGAATAVGAAIGALLGTGQTHGKRIIDRMRGYTELRCDDATLKVLLSRQLSLVNALLHRGHASVLPIQLPDHSKSSRSPAARLPAEVDEARIHPHWSRLAQTPNQPGIAGAARQAALERMSGSIEAMLRQLPATAISR